MAKVELNYQQLLVALQRKRVEASAAEFGILWGHGPALEVECDTTIPSFIAPEGF